VLAIEMALVSCAAGDHSDRMAIPTEDITRAILVLRGHRVLLDTELAALYGITTKRFNEQVRRNAKRFPADFMFQLNALEAQALRSQIATSNAPRQGRGGRRYLPYSFTEHGAIMAATILNSPRAVEMSVYVVRAFVKLRELLSSNRELARRFAQLETRLDKRLTENDLAIAAILSAIRELMNPPQPKRRPIGFTADLREKS
jgi:ORF6N domain-containing protein